MNCFDCSAVGNQVPAVAICADCGAGICGDHARLSPHWLTRDAVINRVIPVEPPARILRCPVCQAAHESAEASHHRRAS